MLSIFPGILRMEENLDMAPEVEVDPKHMEDPMKIPVAVHGICTTVPSRFSRPRAGGVVQVVKLPA
jgi:hypothetical protein